MPPKGMTPVMISSHAIQRWRERVGNEKVSRIQGLVRNSILAAMKKGMDVRHGASVINITPEIKVVVSPSLQGGWEVITVLNEDERVG